MDDDASKSPDKVAILSGWTKEALVSQVYEAITDANARRHLYNKNCLVHVVLS